MDTNPTTVGSPSGNIRLGRRYTAEEFARIVAGVPVEAVIQDAPRPLTREEAYEALFGG